MMSAAPELRTFDPIRELRRHSRRVVGVVGLFALGSVAAAFALPRWYEATLTVVTTTPSKSPASLMSSAGLGELPLDLNLGSSDTERIQAVLRSRSVTDAVIARFKLQERYGERYLEGARERLWSHCVTKLDKKAGSVALTCEDRDPAVVEQMVSLFAELGNETFHRVSASSAGEERRFLDRRVLQARADLDAAAQRVREFQEKHKIIDLGEQSKAVVSAIATLKGEVMSKQLQLAYQNSFSSSDESTAVQLRQQLAVMQSKLRTLEEAPRPDEGPPKQVARDKRSPSDIFPSALTVPELRFELERLFREEKVQETLFLLLTQRLEMAKVNEARDTSAFQVLDAPVRPTHHSRPKRVILILSTTLSGLFLALAWVLVPPWWRVRREEEAAEARRDFD